jgi:hypothetical protein
MICLIVSDCLRYPAFCRRIFLDEVRYVFLVMWILTLIQIDWNNSEEDAQKHYNTRKRKEGERMHPGNHCSSGIKYFVKKINKI